MLIINFNLKLSQFYKYNTAMNKINKTRKRTRSMPWRPYCISKNAWLNETKAISSITENQRDHP